ncbi:MAG: glycosyltransferase family 9 protein [Phycisphaerae bacterium]
MQPWRPPDPAFVRSVLVILPTWVGDFVMATPLLRAIRSRFAEARIVFLGEANLRDLIDGCPWTDSVVDLPAKKARTLWHRRYRRMIGSLRRERFDLAVLLPNSFRAALTARLAGASRRVGYDRDGRGWLLTDRVAVRNVRSKWSTGDRGHASGSPGSRAAIGPNLPPWQPTEDALRVPPELPGKPSPYIPMRLVDYYADLAEHLSCDRPDDRFELFTTPECEQRAEDHLKRLGLSDDDRLIVISPGAKYGASKCWMPDRFAAVADRLIQHFDARIFITCGPGEEPMARAIRDRMSRPAVVADEPGFSLGELKCLIRRCSLMLCTDSGPRHIAKAFGRAVVTVFGPTHVEWTATEYPLERIVRVDVDCGPCQQRACPLGHLECMDGITVDAVVRASMALLDGGACRIAANRVSTPS